MKNLIKIVSAAITTGLCIACSTSVKHNEPDPPPPDSSKRQVSLRIMTNNYTRAGEDEIAALRIAIYKMKNATLSHVKTYEALKVNDESGLYTFHVENLTNPPYLAVAFANINDENVINNAFISEPSQISSLTDGSGNLVMTSARYYDTWNSNTDIFYSTIDEDNLLNGTPVQIYLERVASKLTVSKSDNSNLANMEVRDGQDNPRQLSLELTAWATSATDKSSYLLKNNGGLGYTAMRQELDLQGTSGEWNWNDPDNKSLNWAHSVNYTKDASSFPKLGVESEESMTRHVKFSEVNTELGISAFVHETTRPYTLFSTPNARPAIIIAGKYSIIGSSRDATDKDILYRQGNVVLTYGEFIDYFVTHQNTLFEKDKDGNIIKLLKNSAEYFINPGPQTRLQIMSPDNSVHPKNIVCIQINLEPTATGISGDFIDSSGTKYNTDDINRINASLIEDIGLWEIYDQGNCFFVIPVEHFGMESSTSGEKTGCYGIVRNHHYNLSIKEISGYGHGVADSDWYIGELAKSPIDAVETEIKYNITINPWNEKNQDIVIRK